MRPTRYFLIMFLLFVFETSPTQAQNSAKIVRVGSELDFYPYAFVNEAGEPDGFSIELINAVADEVDLELKITAGPWDTVWVDLVEGRIDLLPLVGKLPERATLVEFSTPHTGILDAFFVRESDPPISTFAEANGKSVVVMRSDVAHHKLMEIGFEGEIIPVKTISEGLQLVSSGEYDAFLGPMLMASLAIKDLGIKGISAQKPVDDYMRIQAFAVKKGDFKLLEKLNEGLKTIKANGEYAHIYNKWLEVQGPSDKILDYGMKSLVLVPILVLVVFGIVALRKNHHHKKQNIF